MESFDSQQITMEQVLAIGAVGISILLIALAVLLLVTAGTLKLSMKWIGNRSPSYLACVGWLIAIGFVNAFIFSVGVSLMGDPGALLATPVTWFATAYMIASAADCGLFRGFAIWFVNSMLSGIGIVAVAMVLVIPLAMTGAGLDASSANLQAEFDKADQMIREMEAEMAELEGIEIPETQTVGFSSGETSNPWLDHQTPDEQDSGGKASGSDVPDSAGAGPNLSTDTDRASTPPVQQPRTVATPSQRDGARDAFFVPEPQQTRVRTTPGRSSEGSSAKPRRAADGSMLNPFFQD